MPEISVIIPVYNKEAYVEKALRSVIGQSFADLEVIVINDGSIDRSKEVVQRIARFLFRLLDFYRQTILREPKTIRVLR